jgi:hypothetical protein
MKRVNLFGLLIMSFVILQSCGGPDCDCEELQYNEEKGKWMTLETTDNPVSVIFNGTCETEYDDGTIWKHKEFKYGDRTGRWFGNYENGEIEYEWIYTNGILVEKREWTEKGILTYEKVNDHKKKLISESEWYENGIKSKEVDPSSFNKEWNEIGQLIEINSYGNSSFFTIEFRGIKTSDSFGSSEFAGFKDWETFKIDEIHFNDEGYIEKLTTSDKFFGPEFDGEKHNIVLNNKNDIIEFFEKYSETNYSVWTGLSTVTVKFSDVFKITEAQKEEINKFSIELKKLNS